MATLQGRTVLVTGGAGFIGGHLIERLLADGAEVSALVRYNSRGERGTLDWLDRELVANVNVLPGELRDIESVSHAMWGADVVMHLGALIAIPYSYVNPRDYFEVNVLGALNVAQAALAADVSRVVHISSSEVYGTARQVPITETHPIEPQSPYAASKVGADKLMDSWHRSFGLPVVVLRPFNTYGPRQSARAVTPTIITQALAGDTVRLGSLEPRRDLTYVTDTVAGMIAAATSADDTVGRTIQLGTGEAVSIGQILEAVGDLLGKRLIPELDEERIRPERSEVQLLLSDPTLAKSVLGWAPKVSLAEGLSSTIEWISQNTLRYRTGEYAI
jgi:NAD dependent epimerase/dehydratase